MNLENISIQSIQIIVEIYNLYEIVMLQLKTQQGSFSLIVKVIVFIYYKILYYLNSIVLFLFAMTTLPAISKIFGAI